MSFKAEAMEDSVLQQLLQRCASRDSVALEQLYQRSSPLLYAALVRMLRRRSVAEEALQDVFVSIWQRADQYAPTRGGAMAWMMAIARYRAIDLIRHERFAPRLMSNPQEPEASEPVVEDRGDALLRDGQFERCLAQLPPPQRQCLELAFVSGSSHVDIAQQTGNPLGTVKSWIRRALESMRACLQA